MAPLRSCAAVLLALVAPRASQGKACQSAQKRRFFTTGEPGDREGFECLACPVQRVEQYRQMPNDHPEPLSEPEQFVLQYWEAMSQGDLQGMMDTYAGSGTLIRAGGPPMSGNKRTPLGEDSPINGSAGYDHEANKSGLLYFFYATMTATWIGNGGVFSGNNSGLHVAIQDIVQVSKDFAIVTTIINGTQYGIASGAPYYPWASMKQSLTVRDFGGSIGWKIVHFTCSFYSYSWLGADEAKCMPGASSGAPPPHVDWSAADAYSVKFTDQANYCSQRCTCGEAPVSPAGDEGSAPCDEEAEADYRSEFYLSDEPAAEPGGSCLLCPGDGESRQSFADGSPERFAADFVRALGNGHSGATEQYTQHAVIVRNGGPAITGPYSAPTSSQYDAGMDFFTHLWPGLTYLAPSAAAGAGGMQLAVQRSIRVGASAAEVLLFTNGTLYNASTGEVAIPWMAKKVAVSLLCEGTRQRHQWKVVKLAAMDYNANGVSRCTFDGLAQNHSYCLSRCPCGEVLPLPPAEAAAERVAYRRAGRALV